MSAKKRGLGRGLDSLFGGGTNPEEAGSGGAVTAPIGELGPGKSQPRRNMAPESLQQLAESIKARGVIQPIVVRQQPGSPAYEIIAGERRWRAARQAGLREVPIVVTKLDDNQAMFAALVENLQREDLNAIDQARGIERLTKEFKLSHAAVAEGLGLARPTVSNLLRLLELHPDVQQLLADGAIEMGHARALLGAPKHAQAAIARRIAAEGLSVRTVEAIVKRIGKDPLTGSRSSGKVDGDVKHLERELTEKLGTKVELKQSGKRSGRLVISYRSLDALDRVLKKLKK